VGRSFLALNRGKRSAAIDWRTPAGRSCLERLLVGADVVIADEFGQPFAPDEVLAFNPRLICATVTPFGTNNRYSRLPGYDPLVQAATGIMATSRDLDGAPISIGYRISEGTTPMLLAHGIMIALLVRERTGRGQRVDVSKAQTAVAMQTTQLVWVADDPGPPRNSYLAGAGCYLCADGRYINVNALQVRQQEAMYRCLGLESVLAETADSVPLERQQTFRSLLSGMFETAPSTKWLRLLEEADVPSGPLLSRSDLFVEPQVLENGLRATVAHPAGASRRSSASSGPVLSSRRLRVTSPWPRLAARSTAPPT
jgi:crotonobetainyl-CoA:carnitine CoA-transferase CaiB-like acyl-CoA transferase